MSGVDRSPSGALVFSENAELAAELLAAGRPLADATGGALTALVAGGREQAADAIARGADEALVLPSSDAPTLGSDALLEALDAAVRGRAPAVVLLGATRTGIELAARLGQRLGVGCVSDALTLELAADGALVATRRTYGGRFLATVALHGRPALATVPSKRFEPPPRDESRPGSVTELWLALPTARLRTVALAERPRSATDIHKAAAVVAVGRGVKRPEDLALVATLADALGGALAGTRPITDDLRWLPPDRKIGLSGQTVRPALYVACGISGQIEHVVGLRGARTVVAINSDPSAPIHAEADYSMVGDLYAIVPALTAALLEARARQSAATRDSLQGQRR